ncbi:MAG: hypothetical protein JWN40_1335 [Phycisphaerales bacterium]|nr:hypothetical protein [Phycisphaerales bacterium]
MAGFGALWRVGVMGECHGGGVGCGSPGSIATTGFGEGIRS